MLKRAVIALGVAAVTFGGWLLTFTHSHAGVCATIDGSTASSSGLDKGCLRVVMSYSEGFVFVVSGILVVIIAYTMINRHERLSLRSELRTVPRGWTEVHRVITSSPVQLDVARSRRPSTVSHTG